MELCSTASSRVKRARARQSEALPATAGSRERSDLQAGSDRPRSGVTDGSDDVGAASGKTLADDTATGRPP